MNLPDPKQLEDARWQQQYAGEKVAEFVAELKAALQTPPTGSEAARARYERNTAFVRALEYFFSANGSLLALLDQREEEMHDEMAAAEFRFRQMRLDRDHYQREAQTLSTRYYHENDLAALLAARFNLNAETPRG